MNLPNKLSVARMIMAFIFIGFMSFENVFSLAAAYVLFIVASITDYCDGVIARKYNLITNFGKLIDPVADKILVSAAFIMMMLLDDLHVPGWTVVVIIGREFLVTGIRSLAASQGVVIAANKYGKTKTALQITYIHVFLGLVLLKHIFEPFVSAGFAESFTGWVRTLSMWGAVGVAVFTVYAGERLIQLNWRALNLDDL